METREKTELPHSINDTTLADEFGESYCYGVGDKNWQPEMTSNETFENSGVTTKNAEDIHNRSHFVWYGSNGGVSNDSRKCASRKVILISVLISFILVGLTIGLSVYYLT